MKLMLNDECILELNDVQQKVLCDRVRADQLINNIKHMATHFLHKQYEESYKNLYETWLPRLMQAGITMVPVDKDQFAALVFSQPDYKCRMGRDQQEKEALDQARNS